MTEIRGQQYINPTKLRRHAKTRKIDILSLSHGFRGGIRRQVVKNNILKVRVYSKFLVEYLYFFIPVRLHR